MKKTAVLIYNQFSNFEFGVALEMLMMAEKPITIFAKTLEPVRSEEGLRVLPDLTIDELQIEEYDSLILTGAMDIGEAFEDEAIINFIKIFDRDDIIIGAISIAPILLLKAGMLKDKPFLIGATREGLLEEGFSLEDMALMKSWDDNRKDPVPEGYIISGNIVTSVCYGFVQWAMAFGRMLGLEVYPGSFGMKNEVDCKI